ncbi:T9SS type A sorting domain-containing protein [Lacinutrix neustonica]|uniref:T9SS type A sorting domain-containing protein n=1 Tax=Lacinutrix neustonica TaxID=2980107 RepID=A0A9E8MVF3_9FLAO|nr:T9SS type A sorting domain-containing protein [Lacinutrix neustonica]WAC02096.1 T9SS type A sorting domain-containing protein [Lacinutrix neustonica]
MKKQLPYLLLLFILFSSSLFAQIDQDVPDSRVQTIAEDLIVQGSIAVGTDAISGESFGFDTFRLKENNLRIHFDDTSTSGTFPSNDWRIAINDAANGGANYFAVEDATAGTIPFTLRAGAGANALFVSGTGGNVGLGTDAPVVELHVADGDSPAFRLEQNGASGFTPQTWDIAGNETNFFVRDVTNGSTLPFRIQPGAPTSALYVAANGNIGLGTAAPSQKLDVEGSADVLDNLYVGAQIGVGTTTPNASASLDLTAADKGLLLNRLTTAERTTLASTAVAGMLVYDTEDSQIYFYNGTEWANQITDLTDVMTSISALQTTVVSLQTAVTGLQNENAAQQTAITDLQNENAVQQTSITDLQNENIAQQTDITTLQNENTAHQTAITDLQNENAAQQAEIDAINACACDGTLGLTDFEQEPDGNGIILEQNIPNPFNSSTIINYNIPTNYSKAYIKVISALGEVIYDMPITKFGKGSLTLNKSNLQSAVYFYSLYVDGKKIATKRLVVN